MRLIDAARMVLEASKTPLHSEEIIDEAVARGLIDPGGETPEHSLQAAIWRHVNDYGNPLGFVMVGSGRRHKKYWLKGKNS